MSVLLRSVTRSAVGLSREEDLTVARTASFRMETKEPVSLQRGGAGEVGVLVGAELSIGV